MVNLLRPVRVKIRTYFELYNYCFVFETWAIDFPDGLISEGRTIRTRPRSRTDTHTDRPEKSLKINNHSTPNFISS